MNPNQNQPTNSIPSIKQPGNWSPLQEFSNDSQPPKQSFFSRYKKLIIITGISLIILVSLTVLGSLMGEQTDGYIEGPKTTVALSQYDKERFSMSYPNGLNTLIDEVTEDGKGWFLLFSDASENPPYTLSVYLTSQDPLFVSNEEGLANQQEEGVTAQNVITNDVALAGATAKKSLGEIKGTDGKDYYVAFSYVQIGENFILVNAKYPKDNKEIHDSFDAVIGSIKLK